MAIRTVLENIVRHVVPRSGDPLPEKASPKPIVMGMRYSVLGKAWELSKENPEIYRAKLFDRERLRVHCDLMSRVMLPSLAAQIIPGDHVSLYVMTSRDLPDDAKRGLYNALDPYVWARVVEVEEETPEGHVSLVKEELNATGLSNCAFAHLRIDDDDALAKDFLSRLREYIDPRFVGFGVSLCAGFAAAMDTTTGKIAGLYKMNREKLAIGLCTINSWQNGELGQFKSIYNIKHAQIDRTVPTIIDARKPAFIRTIYPEQDTLGKPMAFMREIEQNSSIPRRYFPHLEFPTPKQSKAYLDAYKAKLPN
jgi:hypothetical protein